MNSDSILKSLQFQNIQICRATKNLIRIIEDRPFINNTTIFWQAVIQEIDEIELIISMTQTEDQWNENNKKLNLCTIASLKIMINIIIWLLKQDHNISNNI